MDMQFGELIHYLCLLLVSSPLGEFSFHVDLLHDSWLEVVVSGLDLVGPLLVTPVYHVSYELANSWIFDLL